MANPVLRRPPPPLRHLKVFELSNSDMVSMVDEPPPASSINPIKPPPLPRRTSSMPDPQRQAERTDEDIHVEVVQELPRIRVGAVNWYGLSLMLVLNAFLSILVTVITLKLMLPADRAPMTIQYAEPVKPLASTAVHESRAAPTAPASLAGAAPKSSTIRAAPRYFDGAANSRPPVTNRAVTQSASAVRSLKH